MHQMLIKSCIIQFSRLHKTMKKTEIEHSTFRENMSEAMAQADFPTQDMIDEIEKELRMFKFFY